MADKTIGQVSVKVVPDTTKFREEAKTKLDREEARLPKLKVELTLNDKGLDSKVRAVCDAAQRAVRDLRIGFNVDGLSALRAAIVEATAGSVVNVNVDVDRGSLARAKAALGRLADGVKVVVDVDGSNLARLRRNVEKGLAGIKVGAELDKASQSALTSDLKNATDAAAAGARMRVSVDPTSLTDLRRSIKAALEKAASENKLAIQLDTTRTERQLANFQKRLEAVFGPLQEKGIDAPIRATVDASSKQSIADSFRELENLAQQLGSKAKIPDITNEILSQVKRLPEDFTFTVSAEPNIRSVRKAQKALVDLWKLLKGQLESDKVKLGIEIEQRTLKAEIEQVKAEVITGLHVDAIKLNLEFDRNKWRQELKLAEDEAKARLNALVAGLKVKPDDVSLNKALDELRALVLRRKDLIARLSVETDARTHVELEAELAKLNASIGGVTIPVDPDLSKTGVASFLAAMKFLTRGRNISIDLDIKKGALAALSVVSVLSGWDALVTSIVDAHEGVVELFTEMPKIMLIVPAVLALAGGFLSAAAGVTALVGNLLQALPILLTLPGIAIGITAMVFAFKDFGKVLPGVVSQFKALQPLVSGRFWAEAKAPIQDLANNALGQLRTGLAQVGTALGVFFSALSGSLNKVLGTNVLAGWLGQLSASILVFTGFTPKLAEIFKLFGDIGSQLLVPLATFMGTLVTRFDTWLTGLVNAAGGVKAFADQTFAAFQGIVEFVISIGNVFGGVFSAAAQAGAVSFQSLADNMNAFAKLIKDPAFQQALVGLFGAAFQAMNNFLSAAGPALAAVFGSLSTVLTAVLPQVGTVLGQLATVIGNIFSNPAVTAGLQAFITGILAGVSAIIPALEPLGNLIAVLGPVLGQFAAQIGSVFAALAPQVGELVTSIGPLIALFGGALVQALTAVAPLIDVVIGALNSVLTQLAPMLRPVIAALLIIVNAIVPPLMSLITQLVPPLMAIVGAILPVIAQILMAIAPVLAQIITVVLAAAVPLITMLAPLFGELAKMIGDLLTAVMPIVSVLLELIGAILTPLIPLIALVIQVAMVPLRVAFDALIPVIKILGDILRFVVEQIIIPFLIPAIKLIIDIIVAVLIPVFQLIGTVFKAVWDFVMAIWTAFKKLFSGDVSGFITDIHAAFTSFGQKILSAVSAAWSAIVRNVSDAMKGVVDAVGRFWGEVFRFFSDVPNKTKAAIGDLGAVLVSAGKQLIQGFIDGIVAMFGLVKGKLGDLTSKLTDWKGPASVDGKLLFNAGQLVIDGFLGGLESRYDAVRKSLRGFTSDIAGTRFASPVVGVSANSFAGSSGGPGSSTFIYNAAPGSSLGAEEDLFGALGRARAFGW